MAEAIPFHSATRYDFLRSVPTQKEVWDGWKVRAVNGVNQVVVDEVLGEEFDLTPALETLVDLRWVVSRWSLHFHVRAWRGDKLPVVRIDFRYEPDARRWRVQKWLAGWTATTLPNYDELKPRSWDPRVAWNWLNQRGVTDHTDVDGWRMQRVGSQFVRAWKGPRLPVRNKAQIIKARDQVRDWRNSVKLYADREPWRCVDRPKWLPEDVPVSDIEQNRLDLAYLL